MHRQALLGCAQLDSYFSILKIGRSYLCWPEAWDNKERWRVAVHHSYTLISDCGALITPSAWKVIKSKQQFVSPKGAGEIACQGQIPSRQGQVHLLRQQSACGEGQGWGQATAAGRVLQKENTQGLSQAVWRFTLPPRGHKLCLPSGYPLGDILSLPLPPGRQTVFLRNQI